MSQDAGVPVDPNKPVRTGQGNNGNQGGVWSRGGRDTWGGANTPDYGTGVGPTTPYWDWIANAAKDLPGEDDYYKRQIGQAQRVLGAQSQAAEGSLNEALAQRGFGAGTLTGTGYADIQRQTGQQLGNALNSINDARFTAREGRINAAQGRVFQDQQSAKNFQYQLQILKMQLEAQGNSAQAGMIGGILGNLAQIFGWGSGNDAAGGTDPYTQMNPPPGQHWNP